MTDEELELLQAEVRTLGIILRQICSLIAEQNVTSKRLLYRLELLLEHSASQMEHLSRAGFVLYESRLQETIDLVKRAAQ